MGDNAIWAREGDRLALITGASGGIGEAFARLLAAEGWALALCARNEVELNRVAGVVHAAHGVPVHVAPVDLAAPRGAQMLLDRLRARGLAPDVLINNAGIGLMGRALEMERTRQLRVIDLNVRAAIDLALALMPHMAARGAGGVLNVASLAAFMPGPGMAVYHASKAALLSFSEALAEETRGQGLTITALCPGPVRTGFQERAGMTGSLTTRLLPAARAEAVARAGWQGFKEGRVVVVPGIVARLLVLGGRLAPRFVVRRAAAIMAGGRRASGKRSAPPRS